MPIVKELTDLDVTHVSYVRKGANKREFFMMKSDNGEPDFEREFNVIINKAEEEKKLVYGIVYEPDTTDSQNEFAKAEEIEKAAHKFLENCRNVDLQHNFQSGFGTVAESYVAPADFKIGEQAVKKGSWVLVTKASNEVWEDIKKGTITGYSMAGKAKKSTVKKEAFDDSQDDVKGFFDLMKNFFGGSKLEKAENTSQVKTFTQRMVVNDVMDNMWKVTDALRSTMSDILRDTEVKNKQVELNKAVDEFAAYMKKRVANVDNNDMKKSAESFFAPEPVLKAGKLISTANMNKIKGAHEVF